MMRPDTGGCVVMREPEPIPIHEIPAEPGAASSEAGASATERGLDFLAGVVSFGAGLVVSALDGEQDDDRSAGLAAFVAAGAGLFLEGLPAAAPGLGSIERTAGPAIRPSGGPPNHRGPPAPLAGNGAGPPTASASCSTTGAKAGRTGTRTIGNATRRTSCARRSSGRSTRCSISSI